MNPTEEELKIHDLQSRLLAAKIPMTLESLKVAMEMYEGDIEAAFHAINRTELHPPDPPPAKKQKPRPAMETAVRVGVGVCVRRSSDGKILVGTRKGAHGAGKVAFPGGHLEMMESWDDCARREVLEETGIKIKDPTVHIATTNDPMPKEGKHYITIFMQADVPETVRPKNLEPDKCEGWTWMAWGEIKALPDEQTFIPFRHFLQENPDLYEDEPISAKKQGKKRASD